MKGSLWFRLLHYWSYKRIPIGSGLTIPFLVGAERMFLDHANPFSIRNLIEEFVNSYEVGYDISIRQCNNIGTLVCCLEELEEDEKMYAENIGNLFLFANELIELTTINTLSEYLEKRFNGFINNNEYSSMAGKWMVFSQDDINTIKKALHP